VKKEAQRKTKKDKSDKKRQDVQKFRKDQTRKEEKTSTSYSSSPFFYSSHTHFSLDSNSYFYTADAVPYQPVRAANTAQQEVHHPTSSPVLAPLHPSILSSSF
jgi:hypothetical protein